MKFPYGICDFHTLITENYLYLDRTSRIPLIEEAGKQLLFLRPRRFGKSLLLSMLENYYDVARAAQFETLFGHLAIGQNPTALHNQYLILHWDFSLVDPQGEIEKVKRSLHDHLNSCFQAFAQRYKNWLPDSIEIARDNAIYSFESLLTAVRQTPYKLYLLIDEYDNFANEIMMAHNHRDRYQTLLYGEGALKVIFKAIKAASSGQGLDRVFITGVSPVVLSDMTSGYNVAENIYLNSEFNDLCGFSESEMIPILNQIIDECEGSPTQATEALTMMQTFYNGYCFSYESAPWVYNPTLAWYFMKHLQRQCQYPREMLDSNLAMDRGKITYISQLPKGEHVIMDALSQEPQLTLTTLAHRFGVEEMLYATKDTTFMISLLYYFGVLTFAGETALGELRLKIPNLVVRKLYVERLKEILLPNLTEFEEVKRVAQTFSQTGNMQPLCDFIEQHYFKVFDNRDYRWANELTLKAVFLTVLFNDWFYLMDSEAALERGYADLTMILRPDKRRYQLLDILIEFKYLSLKELGLTGEQVKSLPLAALKTLAAVQPKLADSETQLIGYRRILDSKYGDSLRLHTYTVVALGFERLVWVEVESSS